VITTIFENLGFTR